LSLSMQLSLYFSHESLSILSNNYKKKEDYIKEKKKKKVLN